MGVSLDDNNLDSDSNDDDDLAVTDTCLAQLDSTNELCNCYQCMS